MTNPLKLMRLFSIRTRMYSAVGVVISLLMLIGVTGLWGIKQVQQLSETFTATTFKTSMIAANVRVTLGELRGLEKDMVIQYEKIEDVEKTEAIWKQTITRLNGLVTTMAAGEDQQLNHIAKDLPLHLQKYAEFAQPVVDNIKAASFDTAGVANKMLKRAHAEVAKAEEVMRLVDAEIARQATQTQGAQQAASQAALSVFLMVVAGAIFFVVPSTLLNMQSICVPTEQAQAFAAAVASGDLTQEVDTTGRDETALLLRAQKDMQESIARIVTEVYRSSDNIRTASHEIAAGNKDLSSRTETAASSLEETAASMQELLDNVKGAAQAANAATDSAQANAQAALQGGHAVNAVIATMQEINQSSRKISDIIGVIDGIAFQTNILALNAAVEAARAGEAGRGFAVVASEVRTLAQRSAAAAKEIKALIGNSVDKVAMGTKQVHHAGQTISDVVSSAQQVSELVSGITAASNEQLQRIVEINAAITQLDQMTQQNGALVDESSSASQSLLEQAETLSTLVSVFKMQGHAEPSTSLKLLPLG